MVYTDQEVARHRVELLVQKNVEVVGGKYVGRFGIIRAIYFPQAEPPTLEDVCVGRLQCLVRLARHQDFGAFMGEAFDWEGGERVLLPLTDLAHDHQPGIVVSQEGGARVQMGLSWVELSNGMFLMKERPLTIWQQLCSAPGCGEALERTAARPHGTLDYGSFSLDVTFCSMHAEQQWMAWLGLNEQ